MPKRVGVKPTKVISFTLPHEDIHKLNGLAKEAGLNRSAWLRRQIAIYRPSITNAEDVGCDHLPVERNEKSRSWWVRLGKSNPNRAGGHCVACWGQVPPRRVRKPWGQTVYVLEDGTEVIS